MSLADNSWACHCGLLNKLHQVSISLVITDTSRLECRTEDGGVVSVRGSNTSCADSLAVSSVIPAQPGKSSGSLVLLTVAVLASCATLTLATLLFLYRAPLKACLHHQQDSRPLTQGPTLYDAYVGYAAQDEAFVCQVFLPGLETGAGSYRLCLQHRYDHQHFSPHMLLQGWSVMGRSPGSLWSSVGAGLAGQLGPGVVPHAGRLPHRDGRQEASRDSA